MRGTVLDNISIASRAVSAFSFYWIKGFNAMAEPFTLHGEQCSLLSPGNTPCIARVSTVIAGGLKDGLARDDCRKNSVE